jgi:hypothetical protein
MLTVKGCKRCFRDDKANCPFKLGLRERLKVACIKENLHHHCNKWLNYLPNKNLNVGDKVEFFVYEKDYCCDGGYCWERRDGFEGVISSELNEKGFYGVKIDNKTAVRLGAMGYAKVQEYLDKEYFDGCIGLMAENITFVITGEQ